MENYFELEPENNKFSDICVDLTHRCNIECANCYMPNRDIPDLNTDKFISFLDRLKSRVIIHLIGAEPTMRDDLPEIISHIKKRKHRVTLCTNGIKLRDPEYVRTLKKAGLRYVLLSMNGAADDIVYKKVDGANLAQVKQQALENLFNNRLFVSTGTIIAKGVNEHCITQQIEVVEKALTNTKKGLARNRHQQPVVRFKSVGKLGRYMKDTSYSMDELIQTVCTQLNVDEKKIRGKSYTHLEPTPQGTLLLQRLDPINNSMLFDYKTKQGPVSVRIIDWSEDEFGVPDAKNFHRGRLTENWTIGPFFEHIKKNEFGY